MGLCGLLLEMPLVLDACRFLFGHRLRGTVTRATLAFFAFYLFQCLTCSMRACREEDCSRRIVSTMQIEHLTIRILGVDDEQVVRE